MSGVLILALLLLAPSPALADGPPEATRVAKRDYVVSPSGLKTYDLVVGSGAQAAPGMMIEAHYAGWLKDGTRFDASYDRGTPFRVQLGAGRIIAGWEEGIVGMRVGGVRQLVIPPELAYGERGRPPAIPERATLVFEVRLLSAEVVPTAPAAPTPLPPAAYDTSPTGLRFADLVVGAGAVAESGKTVQAHYTGWLQDGTRFDTSIDRGAPITFPLGGGRVIRGWDEGIVGMRVGGRRQLVIPPDLAYGERGHPPTIPAASTLIFEVELVGVE